MNEPRGHAAMSGAILQPPTRPDADYGVLYIEVSGCLPMCGHGTIGVATVLVETGMVEVVEPVTTIRLDTPAGLVVADVQVSDGAATAVTLTNVPSFLLQRDVTVKVEGFGDVTYDMAFGGNFYAILPITSLGLPFDRAHKQEILDAGLVVMSAINEQQRPVHPANPEIDGCHHVQLLAPGSDAHHSRHAMVIHPGWFDRSPCGTGTSARVAQLHARGELALGAALRQRVLHRDALRRARGRGDDGRARGRRPARSGAHHHRPGMGHGHGAVPPRPVRSLPGGVRAMTEPALRAPALRSPALVPDSLRAQVVDAVRAALVAGQMSPGEVYSAPQLAERFGVSVTPVREALLELVRDGLLVAVRNRGFRVAEPADDELDATSEVRLMLEPAAAERAARQPGERRAAAEAALRAAARVVSEAAEAGDAVAHVRADRAFHVALLDLAGNPVLTETVLRLRDRSRLYGRGGEPLQPTLRQAAAEHERLVDLVLGGEPGAAAEAMARHIGHVRAEWSPDAG